MELFKMILEPIDTVSTRAKHSISVAVLRDLRSENNVSMERYADELVLMSQNASGFCAKGYVLDEHGVEEVSSPLDKIKRYQRRYFDYPEYVGNLTADIFHIADHAYAFLTRVLPAHRTIITCHDLMLLTREEWTDSRAWSPAQPLFRYSVSHLKSAAKVIAVSEHTKADILRFRLASDANVVVIPPPVSSIFNVELKMGKVNTRARLGLTEKDIVILHVGTPSAYKNLEAVIDVVAELRRRGVSAVLLRAGRDFPEDVEAKVASVGKERWIRQLGPVDDHELASLYGCSDVLLFPSHKEGFGWPVIEAMASGLPVVASDIKAITQSLDGAGIQTSPGNINGLAAGIERVTRDTSFRGSMIEMGLAQSTRFSRKTIGEALGKLYESVIADSAKFVEQ